MKNILRKVKYSISIIKHYIFYRKASYDITRKYPYQCQFISRKKVSYILEGGIDTQRSKRSADSYNDYKKRSGNVCGMACLQMILGFKGIDSGLNPVSLGKKALGYRVYCLDESSDNGLSPMYYKELKAFIFAEYGLHTSIYGYCSSNMLIGMFDQGYSIVVSVSPNIRDSDASYEGDKGGHLVLIVGMRVTKGKIDSITLHNPSGLRENNTQEYHRISRNVFERYRSTKALIIK